MPIVHMISNKSEEFPEGASCPFGPGSYNDPRKSDTNLEHAIVTYSTHHGLCLFESEHNGYHDSDFYMTVWDPEQKCARSIEFASTRGWSYPCYASHPDATEEVREEYNIWKAEQARKARIVQRWRQRRHDIEEAAKLQITRKECLRLSHALNEHEWYAVCSILKVKNFRSEFRKSLNKQIREWLVNPGEYKKPLSRRQFECLGVYYDTGYHRIRW